MPENNDVLLRVEHLCQYFGSGNKCVKAVDDVSFDIKKGEVFGLVGESGCGKTTTGRSIIKLYDITSGNIYFKGKRIAAGTLSYKQAIKKAAADLKAGKITEEEFKEIKKQNYEEIKRAKFDHNNCNKIHREFVKQEIAGKFDALIANAKGEEKERLIAEKEKELEHSGKQKFSTQIQMIFQDPVASLDPRMTVKEIISEGLVIRGEKDKAYIEEKVYEVLELVGLVRDHAGRYPHEFSGGQKQRIGVARAVIMNPDFIIADEPVSALDVSIQAQVINLLNDLRHRYGITILFIAHDLSVVKYFSDRIGVMYFGKMVELATSDELFKHPLHPYTKSLLSAIPQPDPRFEKTRERIVYNQLSAHDYSVEKPTMREVSPGHFVLCNTAEYERYLKEIEE